MTQWVRLDRGSEGYSRTYDGGDIVVYSQDDYLCRHVCNADVGKNLWVIEGYLSGHYNLVSMFNFSQCFY